MRKSQVVEKRLLELEEAFPELISGVRGRGLILGLALREKDMGARLSRSCFNAKLLVETSGADSDVLKLLPALNIDDA